MIPEYSRRLLMLMDAAIQSGEIDYQMDFCRIIGMNPAAVTYIRQGVRYCTVAQLIAACDRYGVSMDWITGRTQEIIARNPKIEMILKKLQYKAVTNPVTKSHKKAAGNAKSNHSKRSKSIKRQR